ncbi:hypothetical protein TNIN_153511 [Trichonephila inaurata madagascariensis]|uniref:Uncharacterized protein n=1 Tax=Trichonephila inaurata madagascariensis TaxID=2747483 RepID=A0A8X6YWD4_9ARAC|nr:hypothetical protein TNIN_153511 [Trichonephila inaurata madagascariensis]
MVRGLDPFQKYIHKYQLQTEISVLRPQEEASLPIENSQIIYSPCFSSPTDYVPDSPVESTDNSEEKPYQKPDCRKDWGRTITLRPLG